MHAAHDPDLLQDVGAVDLQPAAIVVDLDAGDLADQPVGNPGGDEPQHQAVLAVLAPAAEQVELPLLQHGDHCRNIVGIVLQVAVQRHQQPAARRVDAGLQSGRLTEIALQLDDPEVEPFAGEFLASIDKRGVRRAIINDDQFPRLAEILKSAADTLDERRDAFFLVVDRNEDGKFDFAFRLVGEKRKGLGLQHCISPE